MGYKIRRATKDDFSTVNKLYYDGLMEIMPVLYREKYINNIPLQVMIKASLKATYIIVFYFDIFIEVVSMQK